MFRKIPRFSLPRRVLLIMTVVSLCGLAGCALLMPREIRTVMRESHAGATRLRTELPEAFHTLKAGDQLLHYVEVADKTAKPLVLFIHGSPGDWNAWVRYLNDPELRQRAHLIAVDRPGFGLSGGGEVERSLVRQCQAISTVLTNASPGQRVVVVGHSYGGPVTARLAMDYRDQISDLIILAGSIDPGQEHTKWYQYVAEWPLLNRVVPDSLAVANREIRALKPELASMLPLWGGITQRVCVIQGEKDELVPPENAAFAERMLTNATKMNVIRIPEMNHFIPWTQYELVKAEILKHLE